MAELNVQPKRKTSWLLWLVIALVVAAILFFLVRGCNKELNQVTAVIDSSISNNATDSVMGVTTPTWDSIDFNAPETKYDEISNQDISIRGNDKYAIYGIGENILFNAGQSTLRTEAEKNLKELSASLSKRFNGGEIRIFGHTDSIGSAGQNKQLAEQRAESVRKWLMKNGNIKESLISLHPVGESQPVASNETAKGREQNRRVEIVARRAK